jgi:hypothetical protein
MRDNNLKREITLLELIPIFGNNYINLRMSLFELNDILWNNYCIFGEQKNTGYCMFYEISIESSIKIYIDILKQNIYEIDFFGNYKGTYKGVGIGSTIRDLLKVREDIYFDEQYILVGKFPYDFVIRVDNDNSTIYELEQVLDNKIIEITVENKSLTGR